MLSITCKTSIKAVVFLASKIDTDKKVSIKEIADDINGSEHTVGKLLQKLVKANIIKSSKGPTGGFYITLKQMQIAIIEIITAIDGDAVFKECGLGLSTCSSKRPCPIHNDYKKVRDQFEQFYKNKTVADLCKKVNNGSSFLM
ncbi:MAG: Rrf2 family transcriptional regulator [Bacteroidetes bacterium]|nr:Rrf2 family transcriptional regulator [Bacteroidota bacterium]